MKRVVANGLIGVALAALGYVSYWIYGLLREAKAATDMGQRIVAGPMLTWVLAIVPAAMILLLIGVVMRTKSRSA